jgi:putative two-component system response regulator
MKLKSSELFMHSVATAMIAYEIAMLLGLPEKQTSQAYYSGLLHDIGKLHLPGEILFKDDNLTTEERNLVNVHPLHSYDILKYLEFDNEIAIAAKHHHERFNGSGYPDNLIGEKISLITKIVSIADQYTAMVRRRPQRSELTPAEATSELKNEIYNFFDNKQSDITAILLNSQIHELFRYASKAKNQFELITNPVVPIGD